MPVFNPYVATHKFRGKTAKDSSSTAGMGKVPTSMANATKEELQAVGVRQGWATRTLTMQDINKMGSSELVWHQRFNTENYERAFTLAENQRLNRERMPTWDARRMWQGRATPEEDAKARAAGAAFAARFPSFERTIENAQVMVSFMEEHDLDATDIASYITAFRELSAERKLTLVEAQSATDFYNEHKELHPTQIPPLIATRHQREQNTAAHFAKSASATNEGSVTRVVDYGQQKHGVPPESEKYSFKMKVRAMSADELAQRCADDPAFKAALDALD